MSSSFVLFPVVKTVHGVESGVKSGSRSSIDNNIIVVM